MVCILSVPFLSSSLVVVGMAVLLAVGVAVLLVVGVAVLLAVIVAVLLVVNIISTKLTLIGIVVALPAEFSATTLMV